MRQRLGARDPRIRRPRRDGDGDHRVLDAGAERRDEGERQDEPREGEEDVGDAHQHRVDQPAGIAGDRADGEADRRGDDRDEDDDEQRDARAVDDAREDVAALVVGAEPVRRATAAAGASCAGRR